MTRTHTSPGLGACEYIHISALALGQPAHSRARFIIASRALADSHLTLTHIQTGASRCVSAKKFASHYTQLSAREAHRNIGNLDIQRTPLVEIKTEVKK